jgi:hypothetical protein
MVSAILVLSITLYPFPAEPAKAGEPPNPWPSNIPDFNDDFTDRIWFLSDLQIKFNQGDAFKYLTSTQRANTTFTDVNNLSWDRGIFSGDLIDGTEGATEYDWLFELYSNWMPNYYPNYTTMQTQKPIDDNNWSVIRHLYGNHECDGGHFSDYQTYIDGNASSPSCGEVEFYGNICFIMMGSCTAAQADADWIQEKIYQYDDDYIIIVATHYPYYGRHIFWGGAGNRDYGVDYQNVSLWVCGHSHDSVKNESINWSMDGGAPESCGYAAPNFVCSSINERDGTWFLNDGNLGRYGNNTFEPVPPYVYPYRPVSWFLCLDDGSDQAWLVCRCHSHPNPFQGVSDRIIDKEPFWLYNFSGWITLSESFESEKDLRPQFIDINGGLNRTMFFNSTPTFNWTTVSRTSQYHLQVATDSAFSNLVVDLSNINELNYPNKFDDTTNISFTLPDEYALPEYNVYYCRVRAYSI